MIGPKTTSAIRKLNRYQSEAKTPSSETREMQKQLNDFGFKDASGKALKEDGIWGPKTDAVNNDFENNFLDGVTEGRNTAKTVQKGIYPSLPQITQKDVESVITPKAAPKTDPMASQKNPDGTWKQIAKPGAWSGSGGTSAKELELQNKAVEAQKKTAAQNAGRTQFGYQETGGAQSQAYQGKVPGSTYDKTKPGIYTNWTETGGAQGQAVGAPSTGNEGIDMLLGKGKYTGVYNNLNRPSDTIILEKILESAKLPNSANVLYNGADQEKNTDLSKGYEALSAVGIPNQSGSGNKQARPVLVSDINDLDEQLQESGGVDLSDPVNKDAVRVVQKLIGLPEDGEWTPNMMNRLQDTLTSEFGQFDANNYKLSPENLQTLKDIYWSEFYKKQANAEKQTGTNEFSGGGFGGGSGKAIALQENEGKYENDIWRQAGYKGYFDGDWYFEKDKVMKAAGILLDEARLNEGLNLRELQKNKVKKELLKALIYLLEEHPAKGEGLINDIETLEGVAKANGWGDVYPYNMKPEQLEALINYFDENMNLSKEELIALHAGKLALDVGWNLV
jgi:hypothetical protein